LIDSEDATNFLREVKGYIESDSECFAGDNYRVILVDTTKDHLVMPDQAKTRHAD
jgi:hypothetical protein